MAEDNELFKKLGNLRKGETSDKDGNRTTVGVGDGWNYGVFKGDVSSPTNDGWDKNLSYSLEMGSSALTQEIFERANTNWDNRRTTTRSE